MARMAVDRDTHLTRAEIAATALRQFDTQLKVPTLRGLAADLKVAPPAIYHHYSSQAEVFQAVVELVWAEAVARTLELVADPDAADPVDVLVATGVGTRRAWLAHHRVARYLAASPEANAFITQAMGLMANVFERLGLSGDDAAACFHSYSSFMIGAVLLAADRESANEELRHRGAATGFEAHYSTADQRRSTETTRRALDAVMEISLTDPARDEDLFAAGLRRLVEGFQAG